MKISWRKRDEFSGKIAPKRLYQFSSIDHDDREGQML